MRFWRYLGYSVAVLVALYLFAGATFSLLIGITAPLNGFTFTDPEDFGPIALVVLSLAGLAARHLRGPYPERWGRAATVLAFAFAALPPLLFLAALYAQSWRAEQLIGHWPQVIINDPKWIGQDDKTYQWLRHVVGYGIGYAGACIYTWIGLMLHLRRRMPLRVQYACLLVFLLSWVIVSGEPGERLWWWLD